MRASASSMQEIFRDMKFPMTKDQILEQARSKNVSSDIMEDLQMIPDGGGPSEGGSSQSFGGRGGA